MGAIWSLFRRRDTFNTGTKPNYRGAWQSQQYPGVRGTMQVAMPLDPLRLPPAPVTFTAATLIHYDANSPFRPDWQVKMKVNGAYNPPDKSSQGNSNIAYEYASGPKPSLTMQTANQSITYTVKDMGDMRRIRGTYTSRLPQDTGTFDMQYLQPSTT